MVPQWAALTLEERWRDSLFQLARWEVWLSEVPFRIAVRVTQVFTSHQVACCICDSKRNNCSTVIRWGGCCVEQLDPEVVIGSRRPACCSNVNGQSIKITSTCIRERVQQ